MLVSSQVFSSEFLILIFLVLALIILGTPAAGAAIGAIAAALNAKKVGQPTGPAKKKGAIIGGLIGIGLVFLGWYGVENGYPPALYGWAVGAAIGAIASALYARKVGQPSGPALRRGVIIGGLSGIGLFFFAFCIYSVYSEDRLALVIVPRVGAAGAVTGAIASTLYSRKVGQPTGPAIIKGVIFGGLSLSGIGIFACWILLN